MLQVVVSSSTLRETSGDSLRRAPRLSLLELPVDILERGVMKTRLHVQDLKWLLALTHFGR